MAKRGVWAAVRGPEGRTIPSVVILVGVLSVCELSGYVLLDWMFQRFDGVTGGFVLLLCSLSYLSRVLTSLHQARLVLSPPQENRILRDRFANCKVSRSRHAPF